VRFDDTGYLDAWRDDGVYPKIHDELFRLVRRTPPTGPVLDLCCSTGLLAQRINDELRVPAVGIDSDDRAITGAVAAGVKVPLLTCTLRGDLAAFKDVLATYEVTGIVARRCFPELFGSRAGLDREFLGIFKTALAEAGVTQLWLQGRQAHRHATNALPSITHEVMAMVLDHQTDPPQWTGRWRLVAKTTACAYLTTTPARPNMTLLTPPQEPSPDRLQSPE